MRSLIGLVLLVAGITSCGVGMRQGLADGTCESVRGAIYCGENPPLVAGMVAVVAAFIVYGSAGRVARRRAAEDLRRNAEDFRQRGRDARATVLSVGDIGTTENVDPVVHLHLRIEPADGSPAWESELRTVVSHLNVPRPGDQVAVRYLPDAPGKIALADGASSATLPASDAG